jgi:hypothetical protein
MTCEGSPAERAAVEKMLARLREKDLSSPWLDAGGSLPRTVDVLVAFYTSLGRRLPENLVGFLLVRTNNKYFTLLGTDIRLWNEGCKRGWKRRRAVVKAQRAGKLVSTLLASSGMMPIDLDEASRIQVLVLEEAHKLNLFNVSYVESCLPAGLA